MKYIYMLPMILWALFVDNSISADKGLKEKLMAQEQEYESPFNTRMRELRTDVKQMTGSLTVTLHPLTGDQENRLKIISQQWQAIQNLELQHPRLTGNQPRYQIHVIDEYQQLCKFVFSRNSLACIQKAWASSPQWSVEYTISAIKDLIRVGVLKLTDLAHESDRIIVGNFTDACFPKPIVHLTEKGEKWGASSFITPHS